MIPPADSRRSLQRHLFGFALLALLVAAGLAQLGRWQLQRAQEKEALLDGIERARSSELAELSRLPPDSELRFRAVSVRGQFLGDRQVLLDNQLQQGRPGVRAYVPFQLAADSRLVLVDRGWQARPDRTQALPVAAVPQGEVELRGVLLDPPGAGMLLGRAQHSTWPVLLTRIDLAELQSRLGLPLLDFVLEDLDTPRAESIRAGMLPPERHRGYAVQWFGLSLTILIIYAVLALRAWRGLTRKPKP